MLRRRVSALGQEALRAVWSLADSAQSRIIVSSRHGEFRRTLSILEDLADRTEVSPADFTLSVHHALAGLLSIAHGNRQGHTAVAAGSESFCFGLMEAVACLADAPDTPVVLLHYDEPLPSPFSDFDEPAPAAEVLALVLAADGPGVPLSLAFVPALTKAERSVSPAAAFLRFLETPAQTELVSSGDRLEWHWRRHATAD
ncbi:MAG TPA: beta-ketoacyl synthase chain length factor [Aliidongia sp.]|nr:beta-ketoacyl synthase chain length factor [Aliidongia sp.]HEV2676098.1 beta-ketoacyl synthase chain length factor [Aliidongia sp.]